MCLDDFVSMVHRWAMIVTKFCIFNWLLSHFPFIFKFDKLSNLFNLIKVFKSTEAMTAGGTSISILKCGPYSRDVEFWNWYPPYGLPWNDILDITYRPLLAGILLRKIKKINRGNHNISRCNELTLVQRVLFIVA